MTAPGPGTFVSAARRTPAAGALIAVLLATGVKDALRMGYLLLFIMKARQPGRQLGGRGPLPPSPPTSLPQGPVLVPTLSQPQEGPGQFPQGRLSRRGAAAVPRPAAQSTHGDAARWL